MLRGTEGVLNVRETGHEPGDVVSFAIEVSADVDIRRALAERIVAAGLGLLELHQRGMSLEDVYLRAVADQARDAP